MSQQGDSHRSHHDQEDDWWRQLYDDASGGSGGSAGPGAASEAGGAADEAGAASAGAASGGGGATSDSIDAHFDSALNAVSPPPPPPPAADTLKLRRPTAPRPPASWPQPTREAAPAAPPAPAAPAAPAPSAPRTPVTEVDSPATSVPSASSVPPAPSEPSLPGSRAPEDDAAPEPPADTQWRETAGASIEPPAARAPEDAEPGTLPVVAHGVEEGAESGEAPVSPDEADVPDDAPPSAWPPVGRVPAAPAAPAPATPWDAWTSAPTFGEPPEAAEAVEPPAAAPWDAWTSPPTFGEPPEDADAAPSEAAPFPRARQPEPAGEAAPVEADRAPVAEWGAGKPGSGEAWGKTAFAEGDVRWAPELPPGWVAADEEEVPEPDVVGGGPPTYAAEPTAWPEADPDDLGALVADTVLDGAHYGTMTLRSVSVRGDSARFRGQPRRDALLTARFGAGDEALLLVAMASGARAADDAHRAAQDAVRWIAGAVGRSRNRLSDDLRAARRGSLKSGLHRLTDRCYGRLRARGEDLGLDEGAYTASLRCLLLPVDPECRIRLFFGVGDGGLFRIRDGHWQDLDLAPDETAAPFRFRASVAQPGDALVMCSGGLAEPLRGEPALATHVAARWGGGPPGMAAYLADAQTRVKGYADDRTAVTVWEA